MQRLSGNLALFLLNRSWRGQISCDLSLTPRSSKKQILQTQFMNKCSHSFRKHWTHGFQFSCLFALIAQSLVCWVAQASSGEMPPNDVTVVGLVGAYNFDEGSGTTVTDLSGNGNTGTINGASWTSQGKFGNALNFDAISNWITVNASNSLDLTTGMTLEA